MSVTTSQARVDEELRADWPAEDGLAERTGFLLAAHVPLSLLLDIADPCGPHSSELFTAEPAIADWLVRPRRPM